MNTRKIKRIWIYTALLCVSLTGFVFSCYGPEIDELDNRVREVEKTLADLKQKVDDKRFITSVIAIGGGFRVTFDDNSSYDITTGATGAPGTNGLSWQINEHDSLWYFSNASGGFTSSGWRAIPRDGRSGADGANGVNGQPGPAAPSPKISPDGFWIFYEWDSADSTYHDVISRIPAAMTPYTVDHVKYVDLFIPWVDSINFVPPKIVYDSIALPRYYEEPLVLYFRGYGYLSGNAANPTVQVLDSLSFNYWDVLSSGSSGWGGERKFNTDTLVAWGLPPKGQLAVLFSSNKAFSGPLILQDSKKDANAFFEIDSRNAPAVADLLTKSYSDETYYSLLNIREYLPSSGPVVKAGNIFYYLANDTVRSIKGYPIRAASPAIGYIGITSITGSSGYTVASGRQGFTDVAPGIHSLTFGPDSAYMYDYHIYDTASTSLLTFPTTRTFSIPAPAAPALPLDTPSYVLFVGKLLYNGNIQTDTILISTRDTVRDLKIYPLP